MREEDTLHLAERRDRDAVENVVALVQQRLGDRDERRVKRAVAQELRQFRGRCENDLVLEAARERDGVEIGNGADAQRRERHGRQFLELFDFAQALFPFRRRPRFERADGEQAEFREWLGIFHAVARLASRVPVAGAAGAAAGAASTLVAAVWSHTFTGS